MLAIAGGIIIAVLVLNHFRSILVVARGIWSILYAIFCLLLVYIAFGPAGLLAPVAFVAFVLLASFVVDLVRAKAASNLASKPEKKKYWIAQISGVTSDIEVDVANNTASEDSSGSSSSTGSKWKNFGVKHETLKDAIAFAQSQSEFYKDKGASVKIRVKSSTGGKYTVLGDNR